jgi:hypothetical protein
MTIKEFLSYLLDREASRDLARELVEICKVRARRTRVAADSNLVPASRSTSIT